MVLHEFKIEVNSSGQRILIVDDDYRYEPYQSVAYDDFDAVYYTSTFSALVESQLVWLNPIINNAFLYKPFFINTYITRELLLSVCDGVYDSINDKGLIDEIFRIRKRMFELNFKVIHQNNEFWSANNIMVALFRFMLTRADYTSPLKLKKGSHFGYMIPIGELFLKHKFITPMDFVRFQENMISYQKYIERYEVVNIVHLDPACMGSHIIYSECCPQCKSVEIKEERMIHHFRCANIAPEASYMQDGKMVCPKCSREVRHIGVDYDRPLGIYTCAKCTLSFTKPLMMCTCVGCGSVATPDQLYPYVMGNNRFTPLGRRVLAGARAYDVEASVPQLSSILAYSDFVTNLKNRIEIYNILANELSKVWVVRIRFDLDDVPDNEFINGLYNTFVNVQISFNKPNLLILVCGMGEDLLNKMIDDQIEKINSVGELNVVIDYIGYDGNVDTDRFIDML